MTNQDTEGNKRAGTFTTRTTAAAPLTRCRQIGLQTGLTWGFPLQQRSLEVIPCNYYLVISRGEEKGT